MNRKLLSIAMATAMGLPMAAQAEIDFYGQMHVSYGALEETTGTTTDKDHITLRSHDSRFGFKGERDFGNGLKGTYKAEFVVDFDNNANNWGRRNQYVGLKGDFGEVRFGRHDTPLKMAQGKFDQFGDTDGDLKNAGSQDGENREDNMVLFLGKAGDLGFNIALIPGEGNGVATGNGGTGTGDGVADSISASVTYKAGPLYVAVAADQWDDTDGDESSDMTRLVVTYKVGDMQVGALVQSGVEGPAAKTAEEDWLGLSFNAKVGSDNKFKAQYISSEDSQAAPTETTLLALGFDHEFDKKTTGYLIYTSEEIDADGTVNDTEDTFMGVGLKLKFD